MMRIYSDLAIGDYLSNERYIISLFCESIRSSVFRNFLGGIIFKATNKEHVGLSRGRLV